MKIIREVEYDIRQILDESEMKEDEYYALMVTGWAKNKNGTVTGVEDIEIEQTGNGVIYVSKDFHRRYRPNTGYVVLIELEQNDRISILAPVVRENAQNNPKHANGVQP